MDLISRKPAIDALDKQIKQCCKALGSLSLSDIDKHAVEVEMASLSAYRGILENLPTAQPEPHWIPCSERMPGTGVEVLTYYGAFDYIEIQTLEDGRWENQRGDWQNLDDIDAWMPLPEAYKPIK